MREAREYRLLEGIRTRFLFISWQRLLPQWEAAAGAPELYLNGAAPGGQIFDLATASRVHRDEAPGAGGPRPYYVVGTTR